MINSTALTGRLTRDIDLRYTQSGVACAQFSLAVDRQFTNAQGQRETDFIGCVIWRKSAENFARFVHKGSLVGVEGHIQTRHYTANDGHEVYVTDIVVDNFALLEPKSANNGAQNGQQPTYGQSNQAQQQPLQAAPQQAQQQPQSQQPQQSAYGNPYSQSAPFQGQGQVDVKDDDLPF